MTQAGQASLTPVPPGGQLRAAAPGSHTALTQSEHLAVGYDV